MKIGFLTACLRKVPLLDLIRWAGENGFRALELDSGMVEGEGPWVGATLQVHGLTREHAQQIKSAASTAGVEISCLTFCHNMLDPDENARQKRIQHLECVIEAAALLDVDNVSCFVGRDPTRTIEQNLEIFRTVFAGLTRKAADAGVRLALENWPGVGWQFEGLIGNIACCPVIWRRLFEIYPDMGLNFDPSHLVWQGIDHLAAIREFHRHIYHVHAKDTEVLDAKLRDSGILLLRPSWFRYRIPGFGEVKWAEFISTLAEIGYDGAISIEHEDPVWRGDEEKVKRGLILGRKHLEQYV